MLIYLRKKAQSTAEYVTLFAIVVGAITLVSSKVKRTLAGYLTREVNNALGSPAMADSKNVYRAGKGQENSYQAQKLEGTGKDAGKPKYINDSEGKRKVIAGDVDDVSQTVNNFKLDQQDAWTTDVSVADKATTRVPTK
jgi:ribosomal protein S17E